MSDTRTDREELAALILKHIASSDDHPDIHLIYTDIRDVAVDGLMDFGSLADAILAWSNARRIPPASSIAVPHTPEEIWAAADVWCDLDFWDRNYLEYTPDGVLHLASNVNITADREHMPDESQPDIGVDW